jgi:hypothetical protein
VGDAFTTLPRWACFAIGFLGLGPSVQALHDVYTGIRTRAQAELLEVAAVTLGATQLYVQSCSALSEAVRADGAVGYVRWASIALSLSMFAIAGARRTADACVYSFDYDAEAIVEMRASLLFHLACFLYALADASLRSITIASLARAAGGHVLLSTIPIVWTLMLIGGVLTLGQHTSCRQLAWPALLQVLGPHAPAQPVTRAGTGAGAGAGAGAGTGTGAGKGRSHLNIRTPIAFLKFDAAASTAIAVALCASPLALLGQNNVFGPTAAQNMIVFVAGFAVLKLGAFAIFIVRPAPKPAAKKERQSWLVRAIQQSWRPPLTHFPHANVRSSSLGKARGAARSVRSRSSLLYPPMVPVFRSTG